LQDWWNVSPPERGGTCRALAVADLGAGTGYYEPFLAAAVGPRGRVLTLDSEPAMVEHLRRRAEAEGLANVEARRVPADGPVDAVLRRNNVRFVRVQHMTTSSSARSHA